MICPEVDPDYLFPASILAALNLSTVEEGLNLPSGCHALKPGPSLVVRPLSISDHSRGYTSLLSQLTDVGDVDDEKYRETFKKMASLQDTYYVTVIEDTSCGKVIGTATLLVEQKIIHSCALRGRIEDVVVCDQYRGKQLGKLLVLLLTQLSKKLKCYKLSLDCKDKNRPFYEALGFHREEGASNFMVIRFFSD